VAGTFFSAAAPATINPLPNWAKKFSRTGLDFVPRGMVYWCEKCSAAGVQSHKSAGLQSDWISGRQGDNMAWAAPKLRGQNAHVTAGQAKNGDECCLIRQRQVFPSHLAQMAKIEEIWKNTAKTRAKNGRKK